MQPKQLLETSWFWDSVFPLMRYWLTLLAVLLGTRASPDPLGGQLNVDLSASKSADSRSLFLNPGLLGYSWELNGASPVSALTYGHTPGTSGEASVALSLGGLGLGVESLLSGVNYYRYTLGFGFPLGGSLCGGMSYAWVRPQQATVSGFDSVTAGIYAGLHPRLSLGLVARNINQPVQGSQTLPVQWVVSATAKPMAWWAVGFDAGFEGPAVAYEATTTVRVSEGFSVHLAYLSPLNSSWGAGFKWNLGQTQLATAYRAAAATPTFALQRSNPAPSYVVSLQTAAEPYPSRPFAQTALKVTIDRSLSDAPQTSGLFGDFRPTLWGLLDKLLKAGEDRSVGSILIDLKSFPLGLASAEEVHQALLKLRKQ